MAYSDFQFPPSTLLYPPASTVQAYLESFTDHFKLRPYIRFNTRVLTTGWDYQRNNKKGRWVVTTSGSSETHEFDLLFVCNGHHNIPRYPSTPGISSWIDSKRAFHSMFFRNPSSVPLPDSRTLKDLTILVVGGGPSGQDIANDLLPFAGRVLHSFASLTYSFPPNLTTPSAIPKPRPTQFVLPPEYDATLPGTVTFEDGSQDQVDFCILATGYQVDFPFFDQGIEPSAVSYPPKFYLPKCLPPQALTTTLDTQKMYNTTYSVFPLARQLLAFPSSLPPGSSNSIPDESLENSKLDAIPKKQPPAPTLAFLGLLVRVVPFPLVEVQARLVVELFAAYSEYEASRSKLEDLDADAHPSAWDWDAEARLAWERYDMLGARFDASIPSNDTASVNMGSMINSTPILDANRHTYIHKQYPRFEPMDQYDYREALESIIGSISPTFTPTRPKRLASHRALYARKGPLREAWRAIVARGEAEAWVRGVGGGAIKREGGGGTDGLESRNHSISPGDLAEEEWVSLMWRILKWWETENAS
ncbi:hypothetical protein M413DRAFT_440404 [Hebeloma cylindrosporum]|uniref:FAD/NAD(P)-binding domain-containing protein n=1 Tax=Hebeloma cylindrosporum TaxID=76867 RepID=A0A0C2Z0Y6_HEBCY|nr:hypothetical protein M413DRAFT_440404 [Hebeloma cylindrosporum h7]